MEGSQGSSGSSGSEKMKCKYCQKDFSSVPGMANNQENLQKHMNTCRTKPKRHKGKIGSYFIKKKKSEESTPATSSSSSQVDTDELPIIESSQSQTVEMVSNSPSLDLDVPIEASTSTSSQISTDFELPTLAE